MKILILLPVEERHRAIFRKNAPEEELIFSDKKNLPEALLSEVDVIIGNLPSEKLPQCGKLRWLQLNSAGADAYCAPGVLPEGCLLTNATGAYGLALSEHLIASLLCLMKKLPLYAEDQKKHIWGDHGIVRSIFGSETLVVGLGDIGGAFAEKMHALGSEVVGIRRRPGEKPAYLKDILPPEKLFDCLPKADIVAAALPGNDSTKGIFGKEAFSAMKRGSYFLNIGRGNAVDTSALAEALESGRLSGAAVDVTDPEPLPPDHFLWDVPNLIITPHISGFFHLPETLERVVSISADNLSSFLSSRPLKNIVDLSTRYRK